MHLKLVMLRVDYQIDPFESLSTTRFHRLNLSQKSDAYTCFQFWFFRVLVRMESPVRLRTESAVGLRCYSDDYMIVVSSDSAYL